MFIKLRTKTNEYYIKNDFNNYYKLKTIKKINFISITLKVILNKKTYHIRVYLN